MIGASIKTTATLSLMLTLIVLISGCGNRYAALREDLKALKQNDEKILAQLADIQKVLRPARREPPPPLKPQDISIKGIQLLGKADAPLTLIEFTDYHCSFCQRHAIKTAPSLIKDYVDTGKIRYGVSELPIAALHPKAVELAKAAICGGQQGKYWEMRDLFFKEKVTDVTVPAKEATLNMEEFDQCMADQATEQQVNASITTAGKLGIKGTPSFVLGKTNSKNPGILYAEISIHGAQPYSIFKAEIEKMLNAEK